MTSSTEKLDQRCFDCFCGRFFDQEMLLVITFDGKLKYFTENNEAIWTSSFK